MEFHSDQHSNQHYMPNELLFKILSHLNYDELLIVKDVNEHFENIVCSIIESKIVFIQGDEDFGVIHQMQSTNEHVLINNHLVGFSALRFRTQTGVHENIRNLIISNPFYIQNLNFENLVHLEIISKTLKRSRSNCLLIKLINLQILKIELSYIANIRILLDCPNLLYLNTNLGIDRYQILNPNSIKELSCHAFSLKIEKFLNLEKLTCVYFYPPDIGDFFDVFPSLTEFNFFRCKNLRDCFDYFEENGYFGMMNIYYIDLELNLELDLESIENLIDTKDVSALPLNENAIEFYLNFVEHLKKDLIYFSVELEKIASEYFEIIKRLKNLKVLIISGDLFADSDWIKLLKICKTIKELKLTCFIKQSKLDMIPDHCKYLTDLELHDFGNLNFILKLKYLKKIVLNQLCNYSMIKQIVSGLPYLNLIDFFKTYRISIKHGNVKCFYKGQIVLDEGKTDFLVTLNMINFGVNYLI